MSAFLMNDRPQPALICRTEYVHDCGQAYVRLTHGACRTQAVSQTLCWACLATRPILEPFIHQHWDFGLNTWLLAEHVTHVRATG